MSLAVDERRKYEAIWREPQYRVYSPGEEMLTLFRQMVRKREGTLLDLGCGTGRASLALSDMGFDVTMADHAPNCLDDDVAAMGLPFLKINAWGRWPSETYTWVYCCDVLEHIPPERIERVLSNIRDHSRQAFLSIAFTADHFGSLIGHPLHLTVKPFAWWRDLLRQYGKLVEARDMIGVGVFRLMS